MPSSETIDVLNRVLAILERSFPQYMSYARPFVPAGRENAMRTIQDIVDGQNELAARVSQQVLETGGLPDHGDFPVEFTDTHDLDIDYLVAEAKDCLKDDVANLADCVEALRAAPLAQALAAEALGMTKGHLELLESLAINPAASTKYSVMAGDTGQANPRPV
jgi:hypothetical protein